MKNIIYIITSIFIIVLMTSCAKIIPSFTSSKKGKLCTTEKCMQADHFFWENYHAGNYDKIPEILNQLKAAYLSAPNDYRLAAHIGFTHAWALNESHRLKKRSALAIDHAALAVKYFDEAFRLNPDKDWRYFGFYASFILAEGSIHNDMKRQTEGYFNMKKAVRKYPEFNLFTSAYTLGMSGDPKRRKEAIEQLWENIDKCVGKKVDRSNLDYRKYADQKEINTKQSTCWNTWIAPHNLEGFMMILGDMLVEENDLDTALMVYKNATYIEEYERWDYKEHLEDRIRQIEQTIDLKQQIGDVKFMPFDGCMVCHQGRDLSTPNNVHTLTLQTLEMN